MSEVTMKWVMTIPSAGAGKVDMSSARTPDDFDRPAESGGRNPRRELHCRLPIRGFVEVIPIQLTAREHCRALADDQPSIIKPNRDRRCRRPGPDCRPIPGGVLPGTTSL
jgi:hypothetical protein